MLKRAAEFLIEAKERLGFKSGYALARHFGLRPQSITNNLNGQRGLDAYTCARVADALEIDLWVVLALAELEREKNEVKRAFWRRKLAEIGIEPDEGSE